MINALLRGLIIYITVTFSVRLMGKRQISDLQPYDLVITILISEISAIPLQDNSLPLVNTVAVVLMLVAIEVVISYASLRSKKLRTILDGNSVPIIVNGELDLSRMRKLRMSAEDLMSALRQKDIFDISDVNFAYVETNGALSVLLKPEKTAYTAGDAGLTKNESGLACSVVSDGRINETELSVCGMSREELSALLEKLKAKPSDIFILTAGEKGNLHVIRTEEGQ